MLFAFKEETSTFDLVIFAAVKKLFFTKMPLNAFASADGFHSANEMEFQDFIDAKYIGFSEFPYIVRFSSDAAREAFIDLYTINVISVETNGVRDYSEVTRLQDEMNGGETEEERTIEEMYDLDIDDPWANYKPEEVARQGGPNKDNLKSGVVAKADLTSDSSFTIPEDRKDGNMHVASIEVEQNKNISVTFIVGGHNNAENDPFFISEGDHTFHKVEVYGKTISEIETLLDMGRAKIYRDAEYGCWMAFHAYKSGQRAKRVLTEAGISFKLYVCNGAGEEIPDDDTQVFIAESEHPRPWNSKRDELKAMSKEDRDANKASYSGKEFVFTVVPERDKGSTVYISPASYFDQNGRVWGNPLSINHILPKEIKENAAGVYSSPYGENETTNMLSKKGFIDSLFLKLYLNSLRK